MMCAAGPATICCLVPQRRSLQSPLVLVIPLALLPDPLPPVACALLPCPPRLMRTHRDGPQPELVPVLFLHAGVVIRRTPRHCGLFVFPTRFAIDADAPTWSRQSTRPPLLSSAAVCCRCVVSALLNFPALS